ncbi:hypothetical protein [Streptomyces sp. NPDC003697]
MSTRSAPRPTIRRHGRRTAASALLGMCEAAPSGVVGGSAAAMTGPDPAERIRRLIAASAASPSPLADALVSAPAVASFALPAALALAPAVLLFGTAHMGG